MPIVLDDTPLFVGVLLLLLLTRGLLGSVARGTRMAILAGLGAAAGAVFFSSFVAFVVAVFGLLLGGAGGVGLPWIVPFLHVGGRG